MSSTSLSSLPSELLLAIFTSLDGFPSLASLSCVSRRLNDIWKSCTHTICREIAVRTIGFAGAFELAELQAGVPGVTNNFPGSCSSRKEASIAHARHLAANLLACEAWEAQMSRSNESQGYVGSLSISCREKFRFQQAYYNLKLLTQLFSFSLSLAKRLDETSIRALEGPSLVCEWIRKAAPDDVLIRLGFTTAEEARKNGFQCRGPLRKEVRQASKSLFEHRMAKQRRLLGKIQDRYLGGLFPPTPADVKYFVFFDH